MSLTDPTTGRLAVTGPNGEGALAPGDPRIATMQGLVKWTMPDGRTAWYIPNQNIQQGNVQALAAYKAPTSGPTTSSGSTFTDPSTGRLAVTGPQGEGGLAPGDPRIATMPGLVSWTMPDGRIAYYLPGKNIQQGNIDALRAWSRTQTPPQTPDPGKESPLPSAPVVTLDFRAEAAARYPWLSGALLDQYADFWADTGSPGAALSKLRNTAEYGRTFQGIMRPDGTMRMDENSYLSTKVGFREALAEFGRDPKLFEGEFVKLFENEVGADEFYRGIAEGVERFVEPGAKLDNGLANMFIQRFIDSGSATTALQQIRESDGYAKVFLGNRREDGTLRMEEQEWFAYKRGWSRTLAGFGLNPEEFMARDRLRESVEGEISVQELNQRLQVTQDGILDNIDAVKDFYGRNYGLEVSTEAILGMAIDPDIQRDVLERRITAAQIGGEASVQGFIRSIDRAEELARMGVSQNQAREVYGNAARRLPGLGATTQRFNLGVSTLTNYEDAVLGQDAAQTGRFESALQREASSFSSTADTRRSQDGLGLSGLRQR